MSIQYGYRTNARGGNYTILKRVRGEEIVIGFGIDQQHARAIVQKFKAWQTQGWPYILKDDRK